MSVTRSSQSLLLVAVIAAASQNVSACYPRPHEYTSRPAVSGVLLCGGVPLAGARVMIAHTRGDDGSYCRDARVVAETNGHGYFHVDARTSLRLFTSLLNAPKDAGQMTSVCFSSTQRGEPSATCYAPVVACKS